MKTLTITLHDTDNCGSSLQAFALQRFLADHGVDNEIIDYVPAYTQNNGDALGTLIRRIIFFKKYLKRRRKFQQFIRKHLQLTEKKYRSYDQLRAEPPMADCYITGSDQLWNTMYSCGRDPAFYLAFAKARKISYAVSLGREKIPENNLAIVQQYIGDFAWVSVRESSSVRQLEPYAHCRVEAVCDPVLLNPRACYENICTPRMVDGSYAMIYLAQSVESEAVERYIAMLRARDSGLKIAVFGGNRKRFTCDVLISETSPEEFLSLIAYADYVISNSFHATVFSLIFHRQFVTLLPPQNSSRIEEILAIAGLEGHGQKTASALPADITDEQYFQIERKLQKYGKESGEKLMHSLDI